MLESIDLYPKPAAGDSRNNRDISATAESPPTQRCEILTSLVPNLMICTHRQDQERYAENLTMLDEAKSTFNQSPQVLFSNKGRIEFQTQGSLRHRILEHERVAIMLTNEKFIEQQR